MMRPHDYARIRQIRPEPIEPIEPVNPERLPPAPSIASMVLVSLGLWWLIAWLIWGWL